jgi:uncharacterized protein
MLNYEVDPRLLRGYVPVVTELDSHDGRALLSLGGFQFLHTKLFGALTLPFHVHVTRLTLGLRIPFC